MNQDGKRNFRVQLCLASALALALAACGGGGSSPTGGGGGAVTGPSPTPSPSPTPTPTPTPTATPTPSPTPTPTPTSGTGQSRQDAMLQVMLRTHNAARAEVGVNPLVLDADLSRQALQYAEEMARTGNFSHSPSSSRPNQGENLWVGTASAYSYDDMAGGWIGEKQYYVHQRIPYVSSTGRFSDVGHYTQIIWRNTTKFGCGIATGRGSDWLVCRYSPPGNVQGQFAY